MLAPDILTEVQKIRPETKLPLNENKSYIEILLVEDTASDEYLMRRALSQSPVANRVAVIRKGEEVVPYLLGKKQEGAMPGLILLDLGLPGTSGFDVLQELAASPAILRGIPIVILTGMRDFEYIRSLYDLPIHAYIAKPCEKTALDEILKQAQALKHS